MSKKKEIFCTLGPSTFNKDFLKFSNSKISLLRLDTDFYESTKIELEILFPRLVKNGILTLNKVT